MDTITQAILAALTVASTPIAEDLYKALKTALVHRWGKSSELAKSLRRVEKQPSSKDQQAQLEEELNKVNANKDPEIIVLAERLISEIDGNKPSIFQRIEGDHNIFSGTGSVTVTKSGRTRSNNKRYM
jgi:hypothetical protein